MSGHEVHFDPKSLSLVVVPTHDLVEGACGWTGSEVTGDELARLTNQAKAEGWDEVDGEVDLDDYFSDRGTVEMGDHTYLWGDGCPYRVEGWCMFLGNDWESVEDMTQNAQWKADADRATIPIAKILRSSYDDGPVIETLGPIGGES